MGHILYIHGTGVRQRPYEVGFERLKNGLKKAGFTDDLVGCNWGEQLGVRLDLLASMLPSSGNKGIGAPSEADKEDALWTVLQDDPLFELRIAAIEHSNQPVPMSIGGHSVSERLQESMNRFLKADTEKFGVTKKELSKAVSSVSKSSEFADLAKTFQDPKDNVLAELISRAVVAQIIAFHQFDLPGEEPSFCVNLELRNHFVDTLRMALSGQQNKSVGSWLGNRVLDVVTALVRNRREAIMNLSTRFIGDIFLYLQNGESIRKLISVTVESLTPPILVIAHSLGAVIMFDMLTSGECKKVDLLATVGTQIPFFYAMGALRNIQPNYHEGNSQGTSDQPSFKIPWLNAYNINDFLSFRASEVFKWDILDEWAAENSVPFPASHGAYFEDDDFYKFVFDHWQKVRVGDQP
jgi:hypothetical protein